MLFVQYSVKFNISAKDVKCFSVGSENDFALVKYKPARSLRRSETLKVKKRRLDEKLERT